ncbi:MAG TPA: ATP-binding protein [Salinivirga sp.]|uniref:ATP-binding protein n=1 Tax=Salinivirga sp. TaxID=1970192 RepID=UPI002B4943AF|nr:ATP-binding protein [Salinivirga sp.]HKK58814.1 ATP-binding protein [Salinivirga sp.]
MKSVKHILLIYSLLFLALPGALANSYGVLDLFEWNPDTFRKLTCKWYFVPGKHVFSADTLSNHYFIKTGKSWNNEEVGDSVMGKNGYGTYELDLILPDTTLEYGLDLGSVASSYALYVDGQLIKKVGEPYGTAKTYRPEFNTQIATFKSESKRVKITIHVTNFDYSKGGVWREIRISKASKLELRRQNRINFIFLLFGGILVMSLYHAGLYLLRRKEKSSLYFFFWTFAAAFRLLFSGRYFPALDMFYVDWFWTVKIEYLTFYLSIPLFLKFVAELFPRSVDKYILRTVLIFGALGSLVVLVTPVSFFTYSVVVYQLFTFVCIGYVFIVLYRILGSNEPGSKTFLLGFLVLAVTVVHDILSAHYLFSNGSWFSTGLVFFVVSQAYLLASRFTSTFSRAEVLSNQLNYMNVHLEKIVDERTQKLQDANEELKEKNEEVSRQSDQMAIMNKELRKLSVAASETDNAIIITNKDGEIEWVNRGFERLYGYSLGEMQQRFGNNLKTAGRSKYIETLIKQVIDTRKSVNYESTVEAHDGSKIQVQTTLSPIMDANNELIYLVAIDTDIRKLKKVERELKKSNSAKNKLFSIIAHDLRSPFNSLLGLTELMLARYKELSSEELLQFLKDLNEVSQKTYYLLLNLLEWSRTQRDKIEINPQKHNLAALLDETLGLFTTSFENKNLKLEKDVPEDLHVFSDYQSFSTVMRNLISNAIKFTPRNKHIHISAKESGAFIEIAVRDEGIGISPDNVKRLFSAEESYSTEGTEQEKGTGLGLMLCKSFVEKNEGTIDVESKVGYGTTFRVRIPAAPWA